jgi:hypothetical protein
MPTMDTEGHEWVPPTVEAIEHDTQVGDPPNQQAQPPKAEAIEGLPNLDGKWIQHNDTGRILMIVAKAGPPPFDYAGVVAEFDNLTTGEEGGTRFINENYRLVPVMHGTFTVLPDDADIFTLVQQNNS